MRLRPFVIEDIGWCATLAEGLFVALDTGYGAAVARWAVDPTVEGWVAESDDRPAGFLLLGSLGIVGEGRTRLLEVLALGVEPTSRGKGIGRRLLARALEAARADGGVREVRLNVASDNVAALGLFTQAGFAVDRADDGTFPGGQRAIRMRWMPRLRS